ncbi:hypothetical protein JOC27_001228 [Sporolactobacillus spathodeae]|uniref:Uncharacterized protein n=1 Tax=Sporolactobacillus spathodeae TaxID=1465502 RepID=A0ABS2Q7Q5_9BACL|nr:hypothetical protein [Sporolactobacillus spathodeae]
MPVIPDNISGNLRQQLPSYSGHLTVSLTQAHYTGGGSGVA